MSAFTVERVSLEDANAFVEQHHRHHRPVVGHLFSIAGTRDGVIVGVAIVGRPVARSRDDGVTAEITRLCTDGTRNACSFLYGAATKAALALGFKRVGTYIRADEPGASLTAANWRKVTEVRGRTWSCPSRPRVDRTEIIGRTLWEAPLPHIRAGAV